MRNVSSGGKTFAAFKQIFLDAVRNKRNTNANSMASTRTVVGLCFYVEIPSNHHFLLYVFLVSIFAAGVGPLRACGVRVLLLRVQVIHQTSNGYWSQNGTHPGVNISFYALVFRWRSAHVVRHTTHSIGVQVSDVTKWSQHSDFVDLSHMQTLLFRFFGFRVLFTVDDWNSVILLVDLSIRWVDFTSISQRGTPYRWRAFVIGYLRIPKCNIPNWIHMSFTLFRLPNDAFCSSSTISTSKSGIIRLLWFLHSNFGWFPFVRRCSLDQHMVHSQPMSIASNTT